MKSSIAAKNHLKNLWNEEIQRTGTLTVLHTNAVAQRIGLSASEFEAIDVISRNQPITAGQLAVFCGLTTGAITGLCDRLVRAGYIMRQSDPDDRRKVLLVPVEDDRRNQKVRLLYQPISQGFEHIADTYSEQELRFLIDTQRSLNDMTEKVITNLHGQ